MCCIQLGVQSIDIREPMTFHDNPRRFLQLKLFTCGCNTMWYLLIKWKRKQQRTNAEEKRIGKGERRLHKSRAENINMDLTSPMSIVQVQIQWYLLGWRGTTCASLRCLLWQAVAYCYYFSRASPQDTEEICLLIISMKTFKLLNQNIKIKYSGR